MKMLRDAKHLTTPVMNISATRNISWWTTVAKVIPGDWQDYQQGHYNTTFQEEFENVVNKKSCLKLMKSLDWTHSRRTHTCLNMEVEFTKFIK